jgi:hypothetical protein
VCEAGQQRKNVNKHGNGDSTGTSSHTAMLEAQCSAILVSYLLSYRPLALYCASACNIFAYCCSPCRILCCSLFNESNTYNSGMKNTPAINYHHPRISHITDQLLCYRAAGGHAVSKSVLSFTHISNLYLHKVKFNVKSYDIALATLVEG